MSPGNPMPPLPSKFSDNDARTSRLPSGTISRIAKSLNAEKSELSTLYVSSEVDDLYFAIIEYAALSYTPGNRNPLQVDAQDPFESKDLLKEDETSDDADRELSALSSGRDSVHGGKGTGKRRARFPKYKLALGETTLVWPPPPELEAEQVAADRGFRMTGNRPEIDHSTSEEGQKIDMGAEVEIHDKPITIQLLHYTCGEPKLNPMGSFVTYKEVLLVTKASMEALQDFTHEVIKWRIDKDHLDGGGDKFSLYRFKIDCDDGWWQNQGLKRGRPTTSVILADGQLDLILEDLKKFLLPKTKRWYVKHGLPHRRSLLFYGPPGTGKTSTIRAVASAFRLSCCYLSMANQKFSNQLLADALSEIPPNALLVLEDVDALFNMDRKSEGTPSLTFSGLLNALDGVISADGVICILTTNHLERLDRALVRGGRVDRRFYFGHPNHEQLTDYFMMFYPKAERALASKFAEKVMDRPEGEEVRSIATLQQLFIYMREETAEECVDAMEEFFKLHFPGELGGAHEGLYV